MQGCHLKLAINVIARPFGSAGKKPRVKSALSHTAATKFGDELQQKVLCSGAEEMKDSINYQSCHAHKNYMSLPSHNPLWMGEVRFHRCIGMCAVSVCKCMCV